jgi:hypothetical protein
MLVWMGCSLGGTLERREAQNCMDVELGAWINCRFDPWISKTCLNTTVFLPGWKSMVRTPIPNLYIRLDDTIYYIRHVKFAMA